MRVYIHTFVLDSFFVFSASLYFGDMGGMFCSLPVCLGPPWGELRRPKGGRRCCSRSLRPPVPALGGPLLR